jgi:hypothetical protein
VRYNALILKSRSLAVGYFVCAPSPVVEALEI